MATRNQASDLLAKLRDSGTSDSDILEFILENHMSGPDAVDALKAAMEEFGLDTDEEEELDLDDDEEELYLGFISLDDDE